MDLGTCCFNKLLHSVWEAQLWAPVSDCCRETESVFGFTALFTLSLLSRVSAACVPIVNHSEMPLSLVFGLQAQYSQETAWYYHCLWGLWAGLLCRQKQQKQQTAHS